MSNEKYDYYEAVADDVREYIKAEINLDDWRGDRDGLEMQLNDDLFISDSVTGNASAVIIVTLGKPKKLWLIIWTYCVKLLQNSGMMVRISLKRARNGQM